MREASAALLAILALSACSTSIGTPAAPLPPAHSASEAASGFLVNAAQDRASVASRFIDPRTHPERGSVIATWAAAYGSRLGSINITGTSPSATAGVAAAALVTLTAQACDRDRFGGRSCSGSAFELLLPTVRVNGAWFVNAIPFSRSETASLSDSYRSSSLVFVPTVVAQDCSGTTCVARLAYNGRIAATSPAAASDFTVADQTGRFACLPVALEAASPAQLVLKLLCPRPIATGDLVRVLYNYGGDDFLYGLDASAGKAHSQATDGEYDVVRAS